MEKVNLFEVKAKLSEYLDRALRGERVVICRHNKPVAELRPLEGVRTDPRPIGPLPGRPVFETPAAFFEPLDEDDLNRWEGLVPQSDFPSGKVEKRAGAARVAERKGTYRVSPRRRVRKPRR